MYCECCPDHSDRPGWQLPAYLNETSNGTLILDPEETIYTIWIGTNDLGVNALLTGSDAPTTSIVEVRQCAIDVLKILYESGARNFIMQNVSVRTLGHCGSSSPCAYRYFPLTSQSYTPITHTPTRIGIWNAIQPNGTCI
jgi:hypothetical protein